MNKKLLHLFSAFVFMFFIFLAFGSDEEETTNTTDIETVLEDKVKDNGLTQEQKDSIELERKQKYEKAQNELKGFKKKVDDFEGVTFYKAQGTPNYTNINFIYPYIGYKNGNYWMRLRFQYTAEDWLFINKAIIMVDDEKFEVHGKWERDNNSEIWEWLDLSVEKSELKLLRKIREAKTVKVRYVGTQYHNDRNLTSKEMNIIKKTLDVYENLGY